MKTRRLLLSVAMALLAALLFAAPAAADGRVIQFRGVVAELDEGVPPYPVEGLPGGRWLMVNPDGFRARHVFETSGGPE